MQACSPWRDDRTWQRRLIRDRARLLERLDEVQLEFVRGMVGVADGGGALDFLLVYGSAARGQASEESDVDVYFEAGVLPEPFNREDPNGFFHAFGVPRGSLLGAVRQGDEASLEIVRDAIVVSDTERFRQVLIAVDEEGLT
jgi:hypothetical protein